MDLHLSQALRPGFYCDRLIYHSLPLPLELTIPFARVNHNELVRPGIFLQRTSLVAQRAIGTKRDQPGIDAPPRPFSPRPTNDSKCEGDATIEHALAAAADRVSSRDTRCRLIAGSGRAPCRSATSGC